MSTEVTVYGRRKSTGNKFTAPVEADEDTAKEVFYKQVEDPDDFAVLGLRP